MKKTLVTTTIRVPHNLEAYAKDFAEHEDDASIIVAGDMKTPEEIVGFCEHLQHEYEIPVRYLSPGDQEDYLSGIGADKYRNFLPWDCIQRRNVAILMAYKQGAEIIATVDDDNFWEGEGYFAQHDLGPFQRFQVYEAPDGWFNVLHNEGFYPRGYSFKQREDKLSPVTVVSASGRVVVNGGLWLGEPDIDAVTRLALRPSVEAYDSAKKKGVLGVGTKCPFNSQNTALHRDVIPAYCLATGLGRYDDIVASYIVKRIADHLGDYISFGEPIVRQVRNEHDVYKDLADEMTGMQLIDRIVDWLYEIPLKHNNYKQCTAELMIGLGNINAKDLPPEHYRFMRDTVVNYHHWLQII